MNERESFYFGDEEFKDVVRVGGHSVDMQCCFRVYADKVRFSISTAVESAARGQTFHSYDYDHKPDQLEVVFVGEPWIPEFCVEELPDNWKECLVDKIKDSVECGDLPLIK